jgi:hypothetical protein
METSDITGGSYDRHIVKSASRSVRFERDLETVDPPETWKHIHSEALLRCCRGRSVPHSWSATATDSLRSPWQSPSRVTAAVTADGRCLDLRPDTAGEAFEVSPRDARINKQQMRRPFLANQRRLAVCIPRQISPPSRSLFSAFLIHRKRFMAVCSPSRSRQTCSLSYPFILLRRLDNTNGG